LSCFDIILYELGCVWGMRGLTTLLFLLPRRLKRVNRENSKLA